MRITVLVPGEKPVSYQTAPFQPHSATSRWAADAISKSIGPLHKRVLASLKAASRHGLTDEELCLHLDLSGNTLRPRRRELELKGLVKSSGRRRPAMSGRSAVVWVLV
jgi:hypothetical protein